MIDGTRNGNYENYRNHGKGEFFWVLHYFCLDVFRKLFTGKCLQNMTASGLTIRPKETKRGQCQATRPAEARSFSLALSRADG
jgi:hypothetical protein